MSTASCHRSRAIRALSLSALILLTWANASLAFSEAPSLEKRRQQAVEFEKRGAWLEACRAYDDVLRRDREHTFAREGYQRCLRRLHQQLRHGDSAYRQMLSRLTTHDALEVYEQVLLHVQNSYPESARSTPTQLFHQGLHELRLALDDERFRKHYLAGVKPAVLKELKDRLAAWPFKRLQSRTEVREQVAAVVRGLPREIHGVLILEFAAGACNGLDEHSWFLSPGNLALLEATLRGKLVGVGLDIGLDEDDRLTVTRVHQKSPAEQAGLLAGDRLVRVGGGEVDDLPVEAVAERLRGNAGSFVEVEILRNNDPSKRMVKMIRRAVPIPSVEYDLLRLDDGTPMGVSAGYVKILHFHESTAQDVKEALAALASMGEPIKGLILDLRGNPGGVFKSAVAVAELFVSSGVIVIGQSPLKEYNRSFRAETSGPVQLPLVVLIDGETASSAEVLAGALRDGRPAATKLLGQTTYGKGTVQRLIAVDRAPLDRLAGIQLTVARLFSPTNQPYNGRGVAPHEVSPLKGDDLIHEARKQLMELLKLPTSPRLISMNQPS